MSLLPTNVSVNTLSSLSISSINVSSEYMLSASAAWAAFVGDDAEAALLRSILTESHHETHILRLHDSTNSRHSTNTLFESTFLESMSLS